jgi:glycosyltransferase involved in cell wall biosynthesis
MKKVVFRAPVLTQSGYGVHSRQLARWLLERDRQKKISLRVQVVPWGNTPWIVDSNACDGLAGEMMQRTISQKGETDAATGKPIEYDVSFQLILPNEWDPKLAKFNVGVTAGVETDHCNPQWIDAINAMDLVIVPSQHVKQTFVNSGNVTKKIVVVPEAFADACAKQTDQLPDVGDFNTPFNFLVFGQITGNNPHNDRKNLFYTLKWLCETFKDDSNVGVVMKTNAGRNTKIDRQFVTNMFKQLLTEVRSGPNPRLYIMHGDMSDEEVAALYRHQKIKALVAITRGEGYGLPILEAAASGLPIIATPWSGHVDFLSHGKFIKVNYQLTDIHPSRIDNKIFVKGARWANPSEEDFKRRVQKFRTNNDVPREWAAALKEKIIEKYSFAAISNAYDEALDGVLSS